MSKPIQPKKVPFLVLQGWRVQGLGFRFGVWDLGFTARVEGLGLRGSAHLFGAKHWPSRLLVQPV